MTLAAAPTRRRRCVRCGDPRHGDTFMCPECLCSPAVRREIDEARAADPNRPRLYLMQHGWLGGWGRKEGAT